MDIKKVQVVAFAIRNRTLGYRLLKNPKGSSPYQIKMMKTWSGISPDLDRFDHYHTKSRDFSCPDSKTERQTLLISRLMFWKKKDDKKVVKTMIYNKTKSNGEFVAKNKNVDFEFSDEFINRDTTYIHKEHRKGYHKELVPFLFIPVEHNVPTVETIAEKKVSDFFEQKHKKEAKKTKSFWAVLKENLAN